MKLLCAALTLLACASPACADDLLFSFTATGATGFGAPLGPGVSPNHTLSFVLPSSPTVIGGYPGVTTLVGPTTVGLDGTSIAGEDISFGANVPTFGGVAGSCDPLASSNCSEPADAFFLNSVSLFTGTTAAPVFILGSYNVFSFGLEGLELAGGDSVLTISRYTPPPVAATPEPSSLALLGTGVLTAFGLRRRSQARR